MKCTEVFFLLLLFSLLFLKSKGNFLSRCVWIYVLRVNDWGFWWYYQYNFRIFSLRITHIHTQVHTHTTATPHKVQYVRNNIQILVHASYIVYTISIELAQWCVWARYTYFRYGWIICVPVFILSRASVSFVCVILAFFTHSIQSINTYIRIYIVYVG